VLGIFGSSSTGEPWPVDVLTLDYLFTGEVDAAAQKWGWTYLQIAAPEQPAAGLDVQVSAVASTGTAPAPEALVGRRVSFGRGTALVALISRGPATDAVWEQWNHGFRAVAAEVLVGPYKLAGTMITPDGTVNAPMINVGFAVQDATITRIDGAGDGAPIQLGRGVVSTSFVHAAAPLG
jgi:hypothetical protein